MITWCGGVEALAEDKISRSVWLEHLTMAAPAAYNGLLDSCLHRIGFRLGLQFLDNAIVWEDGYV